MPTEYRSPTSRSLHELESIIQHIDPDVGYGDWSTVLMVIFNVTHGSQAGFELADRWSSGGGKYLGESDVRKCWRYFKPNHPRAVGIPTLKRIAQK